MTDVFTRRKRSEIMRAVKGKDTVPEIRVRRLVHSLGYRYRLHVRELPGVPDLVFPRWRKVIFVHGCFWHRHRCSEGRSTPSSNSEYWQKKFIANKRRDAVHRRRLRNLGWEVLVIWECETKGHKVAQLQDRIIEFLHGH